MKVETYNGKGNRYVQEDIIISKQISLGLSLHIIADGMGGYSDGEIAATLVTQSICYFIEQNIPQNNNEKLIRDAVTFANNTLQSHRKKTGKKLGATFAGLLFKDGRIYAFWLGDVRIYQMRNDEIIFISEDHSLINELRKTRILTSKEIARYESIVTHSLTGEDIEKDVEIKLLNVDNEDTLFICSDGFYKNFIIPDIIKKEKVSNQKELSKNDNPDNYSFIRINM